MNVVVSGLPSLVVREVLVEHAADALHDAARDLALDDVRVDHRPAVLAHDVAQQLSPAPVSTSTSHVHTCVAFTQIERAARGVPRARLEAGRHAGRQRVRLEVRERRDLGERDADRRRAPHARPAARPSSMSSTAASSLCAAMATMRSRRIAAVSRTAPAVIDPLRLPAGAGAEAGDRGVALDRVDVVDVDAERVGGELDDRRLEAVPGRAAGDVHVDRARGLDADRRRLGARRRRSPASTARRSSRADAEVAAARRGPRPARRGTRRSRASRAPARTSRAARCCRRSCRSGSRTAARRGAAGCAGAARRGRCPSAGPRCRAAPRGRATRTATDRGTRCARRCSCRSSWS